jgi:C1A family cysteine protease
MGWLPDYRDVRDFVLEEGKPMPKLTAAAKANKHNEKVVDTYGMLNKLGMTSPKKRKLKQKVNLREYCSPVEDQGQIGSCTAQAAVAMVEYFERRSFGKHIDGSRLFVYKVARNLLHLEGDTGAHLRSAMQALVLFGVPPEEYWPYDEDRFDVEPPAFCYSFAQNYQAIRYYRLDTPGTTRKELLDRIKRTLASNLPLMFGFTVYDSIWQVGADGAIPFPAPNDDIAGGHALMAVGYDDTAEIKNPNPGGKKSVGAFIIRNSWGPDWGDGGYGLLPYDYVLQGLADDWWSLLKNEWVDSGEFSG